MAKTLEQMQAEKAARDSEKLSEAHSQNGNGAASAPPVLREPGEPLPEEREPDERSVGLARPRSQLPAPIGQLNGELPNAIDSERAILGAMIQAPIHAIPIVSQRVAASYFYSPAHQVVFGCLIEFFTHQGPDGHRGSLDLVSLEHYLQDIGQLDTIGGPALLRGLFVEATGIETLLYHVDILIDKFLRRDLAQALTDVARRAHEPTEDVAELVLVTRDRADHLATLSAPKKSTLSVRTPSELIGMTFDEADNFFGDRVIAAGQACTLLGPGGIGKSRLAMQLAVCMITGRLFLELETHAPGKKWLFVQSENSNRRLHHDLKNLINGLELTAAEVSDVDRCLFIHTLETDADLFLNLTNPRDYGVVSTLIQDVKPDFIEWDPLNSLTDTDLNSDMDMRALVTAIAHVTRHGNPNRVPFVVHHSLTGKAGAARAVGWDKSSYGRNSKTLQAWTRAQINLAPRSADDPNLLIMSCGKNNNGRSFPEIGVEFHEELGIYVKDDSFDPAEFREEVGIGNKSGQFKAQYSKAMLLEELSIVHGTRPTALKRLMDEKHGMSKSNFYRFARELHDQKLIIEKDGEWFKSGQKS